MAEYDSSDVAVELLRRQRARSSLAEYCRAVDLPGVPVRPDPENELFKPIETIMAPHHLLMTEYIQRCISTPDGRCMIFAPPGSAKSTYASVAGSSWAMGKYPGTNVLIAGYASAPSIQQSRRVRALMRDPMYQTIWTERPQLREDQRAADDWSLDNGSHLQAGSFETGITGFRFGGAIIDDPVKNREQADSVTVQERIYAEYTDTVLTRLVPHGWVLLIQTRWSEIDLSSSILPENYGGESGPIKCRDGQVWDVLCLPAEAERSDDPLGRAPGEFLWPQWFPREHWLKWRDNPRAQRTWSALFQQRPSPASGLHFNRDMFRWYDPQLPRGAEGGLPMNLRMYGASDYATMNERGDFTEHGVAGMDQYGNMYITDWYFRQCETDVGIKAFINKVRLWRPLRWWNEGGPIDKAIAPAIRRAMREGNAYVAITVLPSIEAKDLRLISFHARASAGTVYLPKGVPWATRLVDLLCMFPAGAHDDAADVCGLLGRGVDKMQNAIVPVDTPKHILVPFTEQWLEYGSGDKPKTRYTSR